MKNKIYLDNGWKFKIGNHPAEALNVLRECINEWIPAQVPGTVHTDLLNAGLIDDPFKENNEYKLAWISKSKWIYKTEFDYQGGSNESSTILVFEGLDTVADIYINSKFLGRAENMFLKYEYDVNKLLNRGINTLELHFESPSDEALKQQNQFGKLTDSNSYRTFIRKAQYSFGWDWGPTYPTIGIWRPVYLINEDKAVIKSVQFETEKLTKSMARLRVTFSTNGHAKQELIAMISLSDENDLIRRKIRIGNQKQYSIVFNVRNPKLWWPNGEGEQFLYDLRISIIDGTKRPLDEIDKKVGIRKIELQLKEKNKPAFRFNINGKLVNMKGMNWIPADSFLPRVDNKKYSDLLTLAKNANANMIRVWGGGIYEEDVFYDLCDQLGLLVWQDFMFACEVYPEHTKFLNSVRLEIIQNVERLRCHPCLAIWCGNNENEWIFFRSGKGSYRKMPGYKIFHSLIPGLLKTLDPLRPYWPTTPFGFDDDPNRQTTGNRHQWDIWSNWVDYKNVRYDNSLFVTEFGFQGPANTDTFTSILPPEKRHIQSAAFEYYNKQIEGPERIIRFMAAHLPLSTDWSDFIYLAQLNQGFALKSCIEHWRLKSPATNGSIIWQLNDCWPVTSWSLIDSQIKPKMAYYFVKNVFSKEVIYFNKTGISLKVNLFNAGELNHAEYDVQAIDAETGKILNNYSQKILLKKRNYVELHSLNIK
jgi:beta-mannosidase